MHVDAAKPARLGKFGQGLDNAGAVVVNGLLRRVPLLRTIEHAGQPIQRWPQLTRYIEERQLDRERWVGALIHAPIPLRLIDGALDPVSGQHMVDRYRELIPNPVAD